MEKRKNECMPLKIRYIIEIEETGKTKLGKNRQTFVIELYHVIVFLEGKEKSLE